ncbi:AraC family transcriptional regulator [Novosphingobium sp. AP12]|uniref:AraC family transcriptional regulator n=1 Tax=Novosphingobium sp. AP12 TaxID=1144305 RepID=UPI001930CE14|nr:AraC family transcriptional regulator [Novosphingobium sp. AP12]
MEMADGTKIFYGVSSMDLSRASKKPIDPLSDVLSVLGARVTRRTRMEASGRWAFAFPAIDRLKFVALLRGNQWMSIPGCAPQLMKKGDVCLLGRTAYAVASDPAEIPIDGRALYAECDVAHVGGDDTIGIGGTVTFSAGGAAFLLDMLPDFMIVPRSSPSADVVATILGLINGEAASGKMGSEIVAARLADVLLVEAIRAYAGRVDVTDIGWLAALSDVRISRALRGIHDDVARPWTVAGLAGLAGMSRAAFSAEFTRLVGQPPLTYVRAWRLTLARASLARGDGTVASIANRVGYTSQSAFGHAFRSAFGAAPKAKSRWRNDH